jgi:hypothetical protein
MPNLRGSQAAITAISGHLGDYFWEVLARKCVAATRALIVPNGVRPSAAAVALPDRLEVIIDRRLTSYRSFIQRLNNPCYLSERKHPLNISTSNGEYLLNCRRELPKPDRY